MKKEQKQKYYREYQLKNKERIKKYQANWHLLNKEERHKKSKKNYEGNKEQILRNTRAYYQKNKDRDRNKRKEYFQKHKEEIREYNLQWTKDNKERLRDWAFKRNYGITLDDYYQLLKRQNGVCAICEKPEKTMHKDKLKELAIDHNHETNKVRGLLCHYCNVAIGLLQDNPKLLRKAADYLEGKLLD